MIYAQGLSPFTLNYSADMTEIAFILPIPESDLFTYFITFIISNHSNRLWAAYTIQYKDKTIENRQNKTA